MTLPTVPQTGTLETMAPEKLRAILFGQPGAGKTTLASSWYPQSNLLIDTEGGTRFLPGDHFIVRPGSYSEFMQTVNDLVLGGHNFTTVTIDTIDNLIRMADAEAGQRGGKVSAGMVEYGKGLDDRDGTVLRDLGRLLNQTDLGVILCAHPVTTKIMDETGEKVIGERTEPLIDKRDRLRQPIIGLFDFELFVRKADHTIVTGGDPKLDVKRRVSLPDELPADAGALYDAVKAGIQSAIATPTTTGAAA